jgi:prepilin-type N-terminal cleavage/methylation domain-containing protein
VDKPELHITHDDGFTLLEIIVAVVILGFVLAGLGQATRFGIGAWDTQARLAERADEMERVDRVLRLVITEAAAPLAADDKPSPARSTGWCSLRICRNSRRPTR